MPADGRARAIGPEKQTHTMTIQAAQVPRGVGKSLARLHQPQEGADRVTDCAYRRHCFPAAQSGRPFRRCEVEGIVVLVSAVGAHGTLSQVLRSAPKRARGTLSWYTTPPGSYLNRTSP